MINIRSIRCSVAFSPYLLESVSAALNNDDVVSRVVRQGGHGLIIRGDSTLVLRYDLRQNSLSPGELRHYLATIKFRSDFFDVLRMSDEVVLATIGGDVLLSHPQSEIWLGSSDLRGLLALCAGAQEINSDLSLPDWLETSAGGDRVLLSDRRSGRWVLLGQDHLEELRRRVELLRPLAVERRASCIPTVTVKGLEVHIQSATDLANALDEFATTGKVSSFEEITPEYSLAVSLSGQGLELSDSDMRVSLTAREARKWAGILRAELQRLRVRQVERDRIRTVFAHGEDGCWILQWGDQVFVPKAGLPGCSTPVGSSGSNLDNIVQRDAEFSMFLDPRNGACVALTDLELSSLKELAS
jgi:hypothetical protein